MREHDRGVFGQAGGGHLVQQWLEEVVVGAVNDDDFDIGLGQGFGGFEATKATANDDDTCTRSSADRA